MHINAFWYLDRSAVLEIRRGRLEEEPWLSARNTLHLSNIWIAIEQILALVNRLDIRAW